MQMIKILLLPCLITMSYIAMADSHDNSESTAPVTKTVETKSNNKHETADADEAAKLLLLEKEADSAAKESSDMKHSTKSDPSTDTDHSSHDAMNSEQSESEEADDTSEEEELDEDDC